MTPIITLTTDFGYDDAYVAAVKGAILSVNPEASIIDITHSIEPHNILQAAFILNAAYRYFPKQTIHTVIVDPGVGSEREAIILKTSSACFVTPDNGILSYVVDDLFPVEGPVTQSTRDLNEVVFKAGLEAVAITDPRFWRHPVSPTFHGRDVFAPVAAGLSLDISIYEFGGKIDSLHVLPVPKPSLDADGNLIGRVLHIDRFGNLITNVRSNDLPGKDIMIEAAGCCIEGISSYYAEKKGIMALLGSTGHLEISIRDGSARDFLGMLVGDEIRVIPLI
ncbi:MAG: SAM-dependent chlorinase/fluorinase [Chloroflexi bacterium]|nr:SAM-dependent chlorinase/fluorinase [Chloroflexota bacterium]